MIKKINDLEMNNDITKMLDEFTNIEDVEGIMLAGSRAVKINDKFSDYDIYIYTNSDIPVNIRKAIADKYCCYMELNNCFWETEDDGVLKYENK